MIFGWIIIGFILSVTLILFIPMQFGVRYKKTSTEEKIHIYISIFGILVRFPIHRYAGTHTKKHKAPTRTSSTLSFDTFQKTIDSFGEIFEITKNELLSMLSYVRKHLNCKELDFQICFGTDNAAKTGYLTGALWTSGTLLLKMIDTLIGIKKINMNVAPDFCEKKFEIYTKTILIMQPFRFIIIVRKITETIRYIKSKIN